MYRATKHVGGLVAQGKTVRQCGSTTRANENYKKESVRWLDAIASR